MCGRFALGVEANELGAHLARQYFGNQASESHQQDQPSPSNSNHNDSPQPEASGSGSEGGGSAAAGSLIHQLQLEAQQDDSDQEEEGTGGEKEIRWSSMEAKSNWRPRYNVAPKSGGVVLRRNHREKGVYELDVLKWGLVPHWTSNPQEDPHSTINAMMESVFEGKPTWRVRDHKRCVVVAQGFYEWLAKGKDKVPHFVKRADGKLMVFAGLWDHCEYKGNFDSVTSYTIITTPVNKQLRFLHSRMPAILDSTEDIDTWLSPRTFDDKVKALVKPYEGKLECYPVDKGVGKVGNDSKDFIKPVAQKAGSLDTLFAKQKATSPSIPFQSASKPTTSRSSFTTPGSPTPPSTKKEEEEEGVIVMNPDEDSKVKSEGFEKIEEEQEEGDATAKGKEKGKKREVETLELSSDGEVKDEAKDSEPAKKKQKKKVVKKKEEESPKKAKTDAQGNVKLDGFFPVLD